jgi:hypothetical protein
MDPDKNLEEQIILANKLDDENKTYHDPDDYLRLAELVLALNEWMCAGGALPTSWENARLKNQWQKVFNNI